MRTDQQMGLTMIRVTESMGYISLACDRGDWQKSFDPGGLDLTLAELVDAAQLHVGMVHSDVDQVPRCWCGRPAAEHVLFPCHRDDPCARECSDPAAHAEGAHDA